LPSISSVGATSRTSLGVSAQVQDAYSEPLGIDLSTGEVQAVPVAEGVDRLLAEVAPKPHDAALDELAPRRRLVRSPQRFRETVDRDDVAAAGGQRLEDDPVAPGQLEGVAIDRQWSEDLDAHEPSL